MIADLKPYPAYRLAEGGWLGSIPVHWEVRRLKFLLRETDTRSRSGKEQLLRVSQYTGVTRRIGSDGSDGIDSRADSLVGYKQVDRNDLVINIMLAWNGSMGVSRYAGISSPAYCVYRFSSVAQPWYYHNLLRSPAYKARIKASSTGVVPSRLRLYSDDLGRIEALLPPPAEQAAIVRFLNWANGRLERAVRAKRKVITLLAEQKQAIIQRAVTRGLDPAVPLKPSGIPWLGEIPAHWEVRKLKHLTRLVNGLPFKPGDWKAAGVPIIRIQNLNGSEAFNYTDKSDLPRELLIERGDLMFAWSGNRGTSFGSFEWTRDFPGYLNQHIFKLVGYTLPKRYFYYLLRAVTRHVEEQAGGIIGLVHVTKPELGSVYVPIAPDAEAETLAHHIDSATAGIDASISRLEREIDLLREYRTRLVADVVTGKLDVRGASARLPDDAALDTVEDDTDLTDEPEIAEEEAEE